MPNTKNELQTQENLPQNTQQEAQNDTDKNLKNAQEAQKTQDNKEKGFFAKTLDKAKELASEAKEKINEANKNAQEFFSQESSEQSNEAKKANISTPSLKSITKKYSLVNCLAFCYIGQDEFSLRIGSTNYTFTQGEILIVPNDATAQWLKHKDTLFVPIV